MGSPLLTGFDQATQDPIDNSFYVELLADVKYPKEGKIVFQTSDKKHYKYVNSVWTLLESGVEAVYNSELSDTLTMPSAWNGLPSGTTVSHLKGRTFTSIFDEALFPTVNPTFVAPTATLVQTGTSLYEVNAAANVVFTTTFNQGGIYLQGVKQDNRSGLPTTYAYTGAQLPASVSSTDLTNSNNLVNYTILKGNQTWTSTVSYSAGPQPKDSKGNNYSTPLSSGSVAANSITIEGVYPIFATTNVITTLTKQSLVSMITGNNIVLSMASEAGGKQKFQIAEDWLLVRPLSTIQTFNTVSNQWETTGLLTWTVTTTNVVVQGISVAYHEYTYNGPDRGAINIKLIF